jgi:hypothetical protein
MKSLVFLLILILCSACAPQGLPIIEPSPIHIATQPILTTITPASTSFPIETITPTRLHPSPTPVKMATPTAMMRWDGDRWEDITGNFSIVVDELKAGRVSSNIPVTAMAVDQNGHLCIGGEFNSVSNIPAQNIACWDGNSWYPLGVGVNERVFTLAFDPSGELYAAGYFTEAGGLPAYYAARWDEE